MTQQCVNCPGAEDRGTAQCPLVSEHSKIDAERSAFEAWWYSDEQRELRMSCAMGWGEHVWRQARASLPVGVPDGWREDLLLIKSVLDGFKPGMARNDGLRAVKKLLAAPTVKAEQSGTREAVEQALSTGMLKPFGKSIIEAFASVPFGKALVVTPHDPADGSGYSMQVVDASRAPSLPAAGSAVEALDAVAWLCEASKEGVKTQRRIVETWAETKDFTDHYQGRGCKVLTTALVSKRKHVAIVAALSAQQSAPERVSVLCEALEDARRAMFAVLNQEPRMKAVAKRVLNAEIDRIDRALLAIHGRGEA